MQANLLIIPLARTLVSPGKRACAFARSSSKRSLACVAAAVEVALFRHRDREQSALEQRGG